MRKFLFAVVLLLSLHSFPVEAGHCVLVLEKIRWGIAHYSCRESPQQSLTTPRPFQFIAARTKSENISYSNQPILTLVRKAAESYGLEPRLVETVIAVESQWNPQAVSPKGAMGLMQLMPQTAARYGVRDPFDPYQNINGGVRYLRDLLNEFDGDLRLALAGYNAGEDAVRRHRGIPPYDETRAYVREVMRRYRG